MREITHAFKIDRDKCRGKLACMGRCPTQALRVKDGKAEVISELCIDCGNCLKACPSGAISATTHSLKAVWKNKYKVAVPSPVLFSQFPDGISSAQIIEGLKSIGFDAVYILSVENALVNKAIREFVAQWKGPFPLIPPYCPVIVRLIQVAYPGMIGQLLPIEVQRELAGREAKRKYAKMLGISTDEVAAIHVTPCQAKSISIVEPAEGAKSYLDGGIGISDVYNAILTYAQSSKESESKIPEKDIFFSAEMFQGVLRGQRRNLHGFHYIPLTGLRNVIHVFDDVEKGKMRLVDFLECYACWGGCTNGNLTVDNFYVARSKLHRLVTELPEKSPVIEAEVEKRYSSQDFFLKAPLKPRSIKGDMGNLKERIKRIKEAEAILTTLPGLNCGLCGAPSCKALANDIASGEAKKTDCIFFSKDRLDRLRSIYLTNKK
ncbi:MAG: 4Fe-4S dicluster domain-containing protein [Thermodesulfobacteriota bacterium]|jgi:Na+-translocating ferredoxin:NAD+ oxidoreductase RNF subunit RnfB|nr:MAG: 4Fe-4S dicluster domain-containing protein [Thermodesulfobacteriota bacterium]